MNALHYSRRGYIYRNMQGQRSGDSVMKIRATLIDKMTAISKGKMVGCVAISLQAPV
jgi:hypothetical protein